MIATMKDPTTMLRLPGDMMPRLSEIAKANGRSRNTEIVVRLQRSLQLDGINENKNASVAVNG